MTSVEKILANHSAQDVVRPGDVVVVDVDVAAYHEWFPPKLQNPKLTPDLSKVFDIERIVLLHDHEVPPPTVFAANAARKMQDTAAAMGVKNYFPIGHHGIVHVVLADEGFALPGQILTNMDSHACSSGALNCLARGMGGPEMLYILFKGKTWFRVGTTTRVELTGELSERVYPRDVIHHLPGEYGDFAGQNLEWHGDGLRSIDMDGRLTMATISAELSAEFSLFPYDDVLEQYLAGRARWPYEPVHPDADATYERVITVDLSSLEPQVVLPGKVARNVAGVGSLAGQKVHQAFIGSCANGRLSDFAVAAEIVKGKKVAAGTRFIVTPGSQKVLQEAMRAGYVDTLMEAGAVVTNSTCGACYGAHMGVVGDDEVCITASTRNFQGRMGSPSAKIFMGSPATVAASAIRGVITDPRDI
jgi:3-isopropylmalate/(R)-2-methylmalate dehydratase large subunit